MNDPKYRFGEDDTLWHRQSQYQVPTSEPCMVLRAKDITSLIAITAYVDGLLNMDMTPDVEQHLASSRERLRIFYDYQVKNTHLQSVGCNRGSHSGAQDILCRAKELLAELGDIYA